MYIRRPRMESKVLLFIVRSCNCERTERNPTAGEFIQYGLTAGK